MVQENVNVIVHNKTYASLSYTGCNNTIIGKQIINLCVLTNITQIKNWNNFNRM